MTPKEQEIAIKELEERVDRLRNIYEQYFLGFERLEPSVPRKDVERRFALLRKEQLRNTAVRFRFNVVTQKYNTYAIHWIRICRQIEEGTYKRHVRRAKARFGDLSDPKRDDSIEVDIGAFEDVELEELLTSSGGGAIAGPDRAAPDPAPPPVRDPSPSAPAGTLPSSPSSPSLMSAPSDRVSRPAALLAGGRPRVTLRKRDEGEAAPPAARPGLSPPAPSSGALSSGRVPVAAPASSSASASAARAPVSQPSAPSGRQAVGPLGAPAGPQIRPLGTGSRTLVGSSPRSAGAAQPPAAPASSPALPPAPPTASAPRTPERAPRGPMPEAHRERPHEEPGRARRPVPLPSQASRPTKKETKD